DVRPPQASAPVAAASGAPAPASPASAAPTPADPPSGSRAPASGTGSGPAPGAGAVPGAFTPPPSWESLQQGFRDAPTGSDDALAEEEPVHSHRYTWLHMVVLVLLAFVLGMVVWMVINRDGPPTSQGTDQPQSQVVTSLVAPYRL